jgi:DNA-binding NtrC family response regulator
MDLATSSELLGRSPPMLDLASRIHAVARVRRTTLISGPTGSGKELVASALHGAAQPGGAPYVVVHCGALPEQLVEAELFGHTRGAFTGAVGARSGLVRSAHGGTLFLDEVDSLSVGLQAKLLRFLESGEYRAVGSDVVEHASVWVLAATNCDLRERVARRDFREDLYFRLDVLHLRIPPLRLRDGDIELLARFFLERSTAERTFSARALEAMRRHDWPGNVRELKHRVERAALFAQSEVIEPADLDLDSPAATAEARDGLHELWQLIERDGLSLGEAVAMCERRLIETALRVENDNRSRAAQRLGIHVRTIFKKLSR